MRRVVVTGLGLVTPLGGDVETSWCNISASKSGAANKHVGRDATASPRHAPATAIARNGHRPCIAGIRF